MNTQSIRLALTFARRELRGGVKGFRIFLACLTLGVLAIAGVGSLSQSIVAGLERDARAILGGDVDISVTQAPATDAQTAWLEAHSEAVSRTADMRAMAIRADGAARTLVQLKAVDPSYPLYGAVALDPVQPLAQALDGGAVIEASLASRLGLHVGDEIKLGEATLPVRALIVHEPDRAVGGFDFGPRVMIGWASVPATELIQPGSLLTYHYRLKLKPDQTLAAFHAALDQAFSKAGWRVRDYAQASPGIERFVERMGLFLTLVGLTALLVGGVGIGNAVAAYVASRQTTIATLKCLGAPGSVVFATYLILVLTLASGGIAIGAVLGALAPYIAGELFGAILPVPVRLGIYPSALLVAGLFGFLTTLAFSLWPLGKAQEVRAASLFRSVVAPIKGQPRWSYRIGIAVAALGLAALSIATSGQPLFATWFVIGTILTFGIFRLVASCIMRLAARLGRPSNPRLRLALGNLYRPGSATVSVVLSLGLGLTVLVIVALIQGNLSAQVTDRLPAKAPTFFFIDIRSADLATFDETLANIPGVAQVESVPSLRGRITALGGVPAEQAKIEPDVAWAVDSDRGLTYAAAQPAGSTIVDGQWWPADYKGPPLISLDANLAKGFHLKVGDTLTVNVLGRDFEATIGNLRQIDWSSLGINFAIIFAPGTLEAAPHSFIAVAHADPQAEERVLREVTDRLPTVSAIRVKDALDAVNAILSSIGAAARAVGALSLVAGTLVLGGAMIAGHQRRVQDAVILKVLGATRCDVMAANLLEYAMLGLATAVLSAMIGSLASWAVVTQMMHADWSWLPLTIALTLILGLAATVFLGLIGAWAALGQKAAPILRAA
jgi:putative ABC transport system permease protein